MHCAMYETYLVSWFSRVYIQLEEGVGSICNGNMCIVLYIYEMYLVPWFSRDLCPIGGGGGVNLQWVYVHCAIYVYISCIWCTGFPEIYA